MHKKTKQKNKSAFFLALIVLCASASFLIWQKSHANDGSSISEIDSSEEAQKKISELEKRADIYRQIIDIKKKQGETLSDQLDITAANIDQVQSQIDVSTQKIDDYNNQILRLGDQIKEKERVMDSQKKMLANIMQSFYEANVASPVVSYLTDGNIASFMVTKDRLSQTGDKISELVKSIKKIRDDLESQSADIDKAKTEVVLTHEKLKDQSQNLESAKKQRETLLVQTQGEEEKYKQLLARVEQQKQELLDIDQYYAASGLSVDSYPKPDSKYYASTDWYYSQRDSRWGDKKISITKYTMKQYGCAITSVAMIFKFYGSSVTPATILNKANFDENAFITWPASWSNNISLISNTNHTGVDWKKIDSQISSNKPVIVYIKRTSGGGHYVVIHHKTSDGKYVVHDPYFGSNIFLNTSIAVLGGGKIDQMIIYK